MTTTSTSLDSFAMPRTKAPKVPDQRTLRKSRRVNPRAAATLRACRLGRAIGNAVSEDETDMEGCVERVVAIGLVRPRRPRKKPLTRL